MLVVEDDAATARLLRRSLGATGHVVDAVPDGGQALSAVERGRYDAVVLDVMLPAGPDGIDVCRALRDRKYWGAILMLTARGSVEDRVRGLDAGADDYLVKPFNLAELEARLRAQTRRPPEARPTVLQVGDIRLDPGSRRCWRGVVEVELSRREFVLLVELMRHPGQVLTRAALLDRIWEDPSEVSSNVVDQTVRYLRRKLDAPFGRGDVETVRGAGYRLHQP
jgi:two-component system, OmpR family, response regulator